MEQQADLLSQAMDHVEWFLEARMPNTKQQQQQQQRRPNSPAPQFILGSEQEETNDDSSLISLLHWMSMTRHHCHGNAAMVANDEEDTIILWTDMYDKVVQTLPLSSSKADNPNGSATQEQHEKERLLFVAAESNDQTECDAQRPQHVYIASKYRHKSSSRWNRDRWSACSLAWSRTSSSSTIQTTERALLQSHTAVKTRRFFFSRRTGPPISEISIVTLTPCTQEEDVVEVSTTKDENQETRKNAFVVETLVASQTGGENQNVSEGWWKAFFQSWVAKDNKPPKYDLKTARTKSLLVVDEDDVATVATTSGSLVLDTDSVQAPVPQPSSPRPVETVHLTFAPPVQLSL